MHRTPEPLTPEEFSEAFQKASAVLWTIAAGVLGRPGPDAEDVLQEAELMALGKLEQFERGTNFQAWAASFVRFVALNRARKEQRRATHAVDPSALIETGAGGIPEGNRAERGKVLVGPGHMDVDGQGRLAPDQAIFDDVMVRALAQLTEAQRSALLLRTVLDMSYREIASVLDMPEGTAMSHVHRARTAMRRDLLGQGWGSGEGSRARLDRQDAGTR